MISRVRVTRRSLTLATAGAALVGVPLLAGPAATAQAVMPTASLASRGGSDAAGAVTFNGGCGLLGTRLGASSTPDVSQVSVSAGFGVRFTNRLDQKAALRLDGEAAAEVPAGGTAEVVFHDGPVSASMPISCRLGSPVGSVTVEVTEVEPAPAEPSDEPSDEPSSPPPGRDRGDDAGTPSPRRASGGGSPDASTNGSPGASTNGTTDRSPDGSADRSSDGSPDGSSDGSPDGGVAGDPSAAGAQPDAAGPPPDGQPADAGPWLGRGARTAEGDRRPRWGVEVEPASGGAPSGEPDTVEQDPGDNEFADQPSRTSGSTPDDGPIDLLALSATVCVVGVSAGAVRALINQRANRGEWA